MVMSQSGDERVGLSAPRFLHEVAIIAGQPAEPVDHRLLALLPRQAVDDGKPHRAAEHGALMLEPVRIEHLFIRSRKVGNHHGRGLEGGIGKIASLRSQAGGGVETGREGGHWLIVAPNAFLELRSTAMFSESLQRILEVLRA